MTTYVLTVDVHDLEPTGPVPATAEVRIWRALPDGSTAQVVSTRQQTLKVGAGPTTVTLTSGVAYWAEFTGVRGWESPFLFSGTADTSIAERWRNGQLDPTGLQPLPAVPLLAAAVAAVQALVAGKAPLASPALTGTPTAPTVAGATDSSTKLATTAFVQAVAAALGTSVAATYPALDGSSRLAIGGVELAPSVIGADPAGAAAAITLGALGGTTPAAALSAARRQALIFANA